MAEAKSITPPRNGSMYVSCLGSSETMWLAIEPLPPNGQWLDLALRTFGKWPTAIVRDAGEAYTIDAKGLAGKTGWRDSGYHCGGTAGIRIYLPKLHQFLGAPQVQSLIDQDPDYFAGDSELLASCVEASRPVTDVELAEAFDHFIEVRKSEVDFASPNEIPTICTELAETVDHLKAIGPLEGEKYVGLP